MNLIYRRFNMIEEIKELFYQEKYQEVVEIVNKLKKDGMILQVQNKFDITRKSYTIRLFLLC